MGVDGRLLDVPHEEDFVPDAAGLARAMEQLVDARTGAGSPHVDSTLDLELPAVMPEHGLGSAAALERLAEVALRQTSRLDHPGFFAHMDPPTPWVTWAATAWAAAANQNLLHPDTAPAARQLESLVLGWLAPAFGMAGGHMTSGSTLANLTGLWAAREVAGVRRVVASSAAHLSVAKAAHLLGLEMVPVPVDEHQRLCVESLPDLSDAALVLVAGTVSTGAIDPLQADVDPAWRHVDAAWAGPLRLSRHAGLLDGIEAADSVAVSAHKWLYQPKDSAFVMFRDADRSHAAISSGGDYLDAANVGVLGSRGNAALPLVATLMAWGREGLAARLDAAMALAEQLADLVEDDPDLELWRRPVTGVVNWRPRHGDPVAVRDRMQGAWVSTAEIDSQTWLRSVAANPLADPGCVVEAITAALDSSSI